MRSSVSICDLHVGSRPAVSPGRSQLQLQVEVVLDLALADLVAAICLAFTCAAAGTGTQIDKGYTHSRCTASKYSPGCLCTLSPHPRSPTELSIASPMPLDPQCSGFQDSPDKMLTSFHFASSTNDHQYCISVPPIRPPWSKSQQLTPYGRPTEKSRRCD